jgi:pyrroloquinoline quinone biosynthesis protein E
MQRSREEMSTEDWQLTFRQVAALGMLHLYLTVGEPLVRKDMEELIAAARDAGLYVNMIMSGVGLYDHGFTNPVRAVLDHLQLGFQDLDEASADHVAGTRAHAIKLALVLKKFSLARTINLVAPSYKPGSAGGAYPAGGRAGAGPVGDRS